MLQNLNQLAIEAQKKCSEYKNEEIVLSDEFKNAFTAVISKTTDKILFKRYTAIITTYSNLNITFPNQWFFIASFFSDYLNALKNYKIASSELSNGESNFPDLIKKMRDDKNIPALIEGKIVAYFSDPTDRELFKKFLTSYDWWFGNKTIDRGDYYVSPILNLSKVVNVSQSYIADLAMLLSNNELLIQLLNTVYKSSLSINTSTKYPLNQILYGPPGTGKTHNAINHALAIINDIDIASLIKSEKGNPSLRKERKKEFDKLTNNGRIQFVTFHQSYSYEEFVEGIKSKVGDESDKVFYEIEDGIFKKLCLEAVGKNTTDDFDLVYNQFTEDILKAGNNLELKTLSEGKKFNISINSNSGIDIKPQTPSESKMSISKKNLNGYILNSTSGYLPSYTRAVGEYIKSEYKFESKKTDNTNKKYVLIIDEINRGNISKIFGELITLIEDSKRIGEDEELKIKLTYSGSDEKKSLFGVPNNVYIIGTMNTADKSIALIDSALRRRFTFIEYNCDASYLSDNIQGINLQKLLECINTRIEYLLDRDHLIGHSYFLSAHSKEDICGIFRNKIIPLLQEYFYNDFEKIQLVLGDNKEWKKDHTLRLIDIKPQIKQKDFFGKDIDGFDDKNLFIINQDLLLGNFDKIPVEIFTSIYDNTVIFTP